MDFQIVIAIFVIISIGNVSLVLGLEPSWNQSLILFAPMDEKYGFNDSLNPNRRITTLEVGLSDEGPFETNSYSMEMLSHFGRVFYNDINLQSQSFSIIFHFHIANLTTSGIIMTLGGNFEISYSSKDLKLEVWPEEPPFNRAQNAAEVIICKFF